MLHTNRSNDLVENTQGHHSHSVTKIRRDSFIDARHYSNIRRKYCCRGSTKYLKSIKKTNRQPAVDNSLQQDSKYLPAQWINTAMDIALKVISHVISVTTVTMIRILQFIVIITKMSVVALLTLIAFPLV